MLIVINNVDLVKQGVAVASLLPASTLLHPVYQVGQDGARLQWPKATPPEYRSLAEACMARDPAARPPFEAVLARVVEMQVMVKQGKLVVGGLVGEWD